MQLKQKNNEYRSDGTASFYDLIDGQWVEEETTYNEYFAPESWEHPLNPKSSDLYVASYFFCPQSRFSVNLGGNSSPISYRYRGV